MLLALLASLAAVKAQTGAQVAACASACLPQMRLIAQARATKRRGAAARGGAGAKPFTFPPPLSACHALCLRNASAALDVLDGVALLERSAPRAGAPAPCLLVHVPRARATAVRLSLTRDSWGAVNIHGAHVPLALLPAGEPVTVAGVASTPFAHVPAPNSTPAGAARADLGWAAPGYRTAAELRGALGLKAWSQLLTFAVVRSPFERALAHSGAISPGGRTNAGRCAALHAFLRKAAARRVLIVAAAEQYARHVAAVAASRAPPAQRVSAAAAASAAAVVSTGCPGGHEAGSCPQAKFLVDGRTGELAEPTGGGRVVRVLLRAERLDEDYARLCAALGIVGCAPLLRAAPNAQLAAFGLGRRRRRLARRGGRRHYSAFFSNASAMMASTLFAGDLAALGYAFERREPVVPECE